MQGKIRVVDRVYHICRGEGPYILIAGARGVSTLKSGAYVLGA